MKISVDKVDARLKAMTREELEQFAYSVAFILYGFYYEEDMSDLAAEEAEKAGIEKGEPYFDSEKEWEGDTIENVAACVNEMGLHPEKLQ